MIGVKIGNHRGADSHQYVVTNLYILSNGAPRPQPNSITSQNVTGKSGTRCYVTATPNSTIVVDARSGIHNGDVTNPCADVDD